MQACCLPFGKYPSISEVDTRRVAEPPVRASFADRESNTVPRIARHYNYSHAICLSLRNFSRAFIGCTQEKKPRV